MRLRLVAVLVGITAMILLVQDVPLAAHLRRVERDRMVTGLERDAFTLAGRAEEALELADPELAAGLAGRLVTYSTETGGRVVVTDSAGIAVATSDEEAGTGNDFSTRPEIAAALGGEPTSGERDSVTLGTRLLYVAVPVLSGEDIVGSVRITYPAGEIDDRVESRVRGLAVAAAISLAVALAAALAFAATVTRPLRRLRAATEQLAAGDLSVRAEQDEGPPEVRGLAASFNMMGERLQRNITRQRTFAGDASHQLRTPLTALRLRLEQAAELLETDPAAARPHLESAAHETERLQHLVDGLLTLARAEEGARRVEVVDAAAVCQERVAVWEALAGEQGVDLAALVPGRLDVTAVPGALEQVLDNLIDNALRVAPPGTAVDVTAASEKTADVVVRVEDRGPGMTDAQIDRAFDRFWRAGDAPAGGSGLGLAVVALLVEASEGTVTLRRREEGGLVAEVRLCAARPQPG